MKCLDLWSSRANQANFPKGYQTFYGYCPNWECCTCKRGPGVPNSSTLLVARVACAALRMVMEQQCQMTIFRLKHSWQGLSIKMPPRVLPDGKKHNRGVVHAWYQRGNTKHCRGNTKHCCGKPILCRGPQTFQIDQIESNWENAGGNELR